MTLPPKRRTPPPPKSVDYGGGDKKLAEDIRSAALSIRQRPGRPVRVTISMIVAEVGRKDWIAKRHVKLPRTTQAIAESVESLEAFTLRKVQWTEQHYTEAEACPKMHQFIRLGNINGRMSKTPSIHGAIKLALENLKARFEHDILRSIDNPVAEVA